jgi:hypothetical protein
MTFQAGDRLDLALAHPGGGQRMRKRHLGQSIAERSGLGQPFVQGFRAVETEDAPRPRLGIALITEEGLDPGGFVVERKPLGGTQEIRQILAVMGGLVRHGGKSNSGFLGFDHTDGITIHQ